MIETGLQSNISTAKPLPYVWKQSLMDAIPPAGRAGGYQRQRSDYAAFIPAPLPPQPPVAMDAELWRLLSDADRALGRLDGVTQTLPDTGLFLLMYIRKEALYSSQIEGTQASLDEVVAFEQNIAGAENPDDIEEVVNYIRAIRYGIARLETLPVSLRLIKELHAELMRGARGKHKSPGEFRTSQNWIGPQGASLANASFVPPPPHTLIEHLGQFETFIHTDTSLPALISIGLAHAQFETIHPFLDGNGRLGRLLITFLLCEKAILKEPALYLSHFFKLHRSEYYQRLQDIRTHGAWEDWLKFFLRGVCEVAKEAASIGAKIVAQREEHRRLVTAKMTHASAGSAFKLLEHLHSTPVISVTKAAEIIERTYSNARELISKLKELKLLEEFTGRDRDRLYRYAPYLNLLRAEE
jgi:Fic family protein